jgi:hypothetical protein
MTIHCYVAVNVEIMKEELNSIVIFAEVFEGKIEGRKEIEKRG